MKIDKIEITNNIAENLSYYRKKLNLTQLELAETLSYSDKTISKWERAEGVPDIYVLKELAHFFGVSVDALTLKRKGPFMILKYRHVLAHFYASICLLVGALLFGILSMLEVNYPNWHFLVYSIPFASTVLLIFYSVWKRIAYIYAYLSITIWSAAVSFYLGLNHENAYWVLILAIPLHLFLCFMLYVILKPKKVK